MMYISAKSFVRLFLVVFISVFCATNGCVLRQYGWEPKSVEKRTALADVIISGTVLRVLRHRRAWDGTFPADVLVADVYKGYELFENATVLPEDEILEEYRSYYPNVYRVQRFGDRRQCWAEVIGGKNYVLYLTTNPSPRNLEASEGEEEVDMSAMMNMEGLQLVATHDDVAGATIDFSLETEDNILKILGWRPWGSWSSCTEECEGGTQTRRRLCVRDVPDACEGEARQKRQCNTFDCADMKDMKQILHLDDFPSGVRRAPSRWSAYRISHKATTLHAATSQIYGKAFPSQFSILLTIKPKTTQRKNHGDSYALLFTNEDGAVEFGIKISKTPTIVYKRMDGALREMTFTDYSLNRSWHYMAFSVRKHTVTLIADCNMVFTLDIERSDRAPIDATGMTSIGAGRVVVNNVYFEGDIDQLVLIDDPSAADHQCSPQERRFPDLLDIPSTALPSSSVNGMDASIDIGLVYDNLFDPFLFIDDTTTSNPMDTTFPQFPFLDVSVDGKNGIPTAPSTSKSTIHMETTPATTEKPKTSKSTAIFEQTISWDNELTGLDESVGDFIGNIVLPVTPAEFGADEVISYASPVDHNAATSEPEVILNSVGGKAHQSETLATTAVSDSLAKLSTITPTSLPKWNLQSNSKTSSTTTRTATTKGSLKPKRTSSTTTPATASLATTTTTPEPSTLPTTSNNLITTKRTVTTPAIYSTSQMTTMTSTTMNVPLVVKSITEKNDIMGNEEIDNNSERPLNDGLIPLPPRNLLAPAAPAEIPRPSIQEYGQPQDDGANWSTWSTCSRTCGSGTRYRYTVCSPDTKLSDCRSGRGIAAQHKSCRLNNDCKGILYWSDWGSCTRTCGEGFETRVAICRDIEAHPNCTEVGKLLIERRRCEGLTECPLYCIGGCRNGGTCMAGGVCRCPPGYEGPVCETELCQHSCKHGGQCVGRNKCLCPYGHVPPFCEPRCNPPCQNKGRCIHPGRCVCPKGYTGPACSKPICRSRCLNGGECIAPDRCRCPDGYTGLDCRQPQCSPQCEHGGRCIRAGFCRCQPGYRGLGCQIPYCRRTCRNGGRCTGADTCTCPRGYTGALCQQSKCPRGCPGSSVCIGHHSCSSYGRQAVASARRTWCPLQSFRETHTVTYIKPAIQKYRVACGQYRLKTCESSRIIYRIGYRTRQRTAYKCAPYG